MTTNIDMVALKGEMRTLVEAMVRGGPAILRDAGPTVHVSLDPKRDAVDVRIIVERGGKPYFGVAIIGTQRLVADMRGAVANDCGALVRRLVADLEDA